MPRRANQRPEGEDSSLALDTRSRAVIQQLVDEKRAALLSHHVDFPPDDGAHDGAGGAGECARFAAVVGHARRRRVP